MDEFPFEQLDRNPPIQISVLMGSRVVGSLTDGAKHDAEERESCFDAL